MRKSLERSPQRESGMTATAQTNENATLLFRRSGVSSVVSEVLQALYESDARPSSSTALRGHLTISLPSDSTLPTDTAYQSHGIVHSSAEIVSAFAQGLESVRANARRIVHRMWSGTDNLQRRDGSGSHVGDNRLRSVGSLCSKTHQFAYK